MLMRCDLSRTSGNTRVTGVALILISLSISVNNVSV